MLGLSMRRRHRSSSRCGSGLLLRLLQRSPAPLASAGAGAAAPIRGYVALSADLRSGLGVRTNKGDCPRVVINILLNDSSRFCEDTKEIKWSDSLEC